MSHDGPSAKTKAAIWGPFLLTQTISFRRDLGHWTKLRVTFKAMDLDAQLEMQTSLELNKGLLYEN